MFSWLGGNGIAAASCHSAKGFVQKAGRVIVCLGIDPVSFLLLARAEILHGGDNVLDLVKDL